MKSMSEAKRAKLAKAREYEMNLAALAVQETEVAVVQAQADLEAEAEANPQAPPLSYYLHLVEMERQQHFEDCARCRTTWKLCSTAQDLRNQHDALVADAQAEGSLQC